MSVRKPKRQTKGTKRGPKVVNWVFTLNNYTADDEVAIRAMYPSICKYIVYGHEVGESGTPHLQGYFQFTKRLRSDPVHALNSATARMHIEPQKGTNKQATAYCIKDHHDVVEIGTISRAGSLDDFRARINACSRWTEVLNLEGIKKHLNYARECWANRQEEPYENVVLQPWQQELYDMLQQPADDRTIIWVYDDKGKKGKTFFAKYMQINHGAFYTNPGKGIDIVYAYDNQKVILYDIPRSYKEECINYGVLEKFKDGIMFSGKYVPTTKVRKENAHVVVFCNHLCDEGMFSEDRIKVIDLCGIPKYTPPEPKAPLEEAPQAPTTEAPTGAGCVSSQGLETKEDARQVPQEPQAGVGAPGAGDAAPEGAEPPLSGTPVLFNDVIELPTQVEPSDADAGAAMLDDQFFNPFYDGPEVSVSITRNLRPTGPVVT